MDFPLPDDDLINLGELRKKKKHGLTRKPYLYLAYFGAAENGQGRGFGRSLLQHAIAESEKTKMELVLETTTLLNTKHYERYGFTVVDRVEGREEWVLMVRTP